MRRLVALAAVLILLALSPTHLYADGDHEVSLDEASRELLTAYQVERLDQIDCEQLTEEELEHLGEAVMNEMHPDAEVHERMDAMMGGEGSESLSLAHQNMALSYLGCTGVSNIDMMGGGMMGMMNLRNIDTGNVNDNLGNNYYGSFPMMRFPGMMGAGVSSTYGILSSVTWIALIAFLAAGTYFFIKQASK